MRRSYALLTPPYSYPNSEARLEMSVVTKLQQWGGARKGELTLGWHVRYGSVAEIRAGERLRPQVP